MRVLNLYAGVGGNRRLWGEDDHITAVEFDPIIAAVYADLYPTDDVVVGDAHQYLLDNLTEFDFIWSSPPCQSHSRMRYHLQVGVRETAMKFPDMRLYEEILLLQHKAEPHQRWVVENVIPWYEPLIPAQKLHRHLYWANFSIPEQPHVHENLRAIQIPQLQEMHGIDLSAYRIPNKRQVLRNMVSPKTGLHVRDAAIASMPIDWRIAL
jgi:DNA (cytosine-5)-methyltransferase 1